MVNVNPLEKKHGLIVLENEVGHQQWALIVDAEVEYDNDVSISSSDAAQYSVTTTLAPGEMLRMASTFNPDEENVLVYSRLLVSVLREERERYAALEKRFYEQGVQLRKAREGSRTAERDHAEGLYEAWRDGAKNGHRMAVGGRGLMHSLERNPHPLPDDDEEDEL